MLLAGEAVEPEVKRAAMWVVERDGLVPAGDAGRVLGLNAQQVVRRAEKAGARVLRRRPPLQVMVDLGGLRLALGRERQ